MTNITDAELTQMKERAEKATAGPWVTYYESLVKSKEGDKVVADTWRVVNGANDARFIAHAREDVPRLVAEVERLQSDNEQYYAKIKRLKSSLISAMSLVDECPECVKAFLSDIYEEEYE